MTYNPIEKELMIDSMKNLISGTINSKAFVMRQSDKENYLDQSWRLVNKFKKDTKE